MIISINGTVKEVFYRLFSWKACNYYAECCPEVYDLRNKIVCDVAEDLCKIKNIQLYMDYMHDELCHDIREKILCIIDLYKLIYWCFKYYSVTPNQNYNHLIKQAQNSRHFYGSVVDKTTEILDEICKNEERYGDLYVKMKQIGELIISSFTPYAKGETDERCVEF